MTVHHRVVVTGFHDESPAGSPRRAMTTPPVLARCPPRNTIVNLFVNAGADE
jgi:hypothetical protein